MTFLVNKFPILIFFRNIILISIALLQFSCGDKVEVHISQTIMFEGRLYKMDSKDPFSGIVYNTYPDGLREYEGEYKDGKPNGLLTYWYNNGNIMREGRLEDGMPVRRWITYKEDGTVQNIMDH